MALQSDDLSAFDHLVFLITSGHSDWFENDDVITPFNDVLDVVHSRFQDNVACSYFEENLAIPILFADRVWVCCAKSGAAKAARKAMSAMPITVSLAVLMMFVFLFGQVKFNALPRGAGLRPLTPSKTVVDRRGGARCAIESFN